MILDTSALIGGWSPAFAGQDGSISVITLAELHFGIHTARTHDERTVRLANLGAVEAAFAPIPVDDSIARAWAGLAGAAREQGLQPRTRAFDLVIAATAKVRGEPLVTRDRDLAKLSELLDVRVL